MERSSSQPFPPGRHGSQLLSSQSQLDAALSPLDRAKARVKQNRERYASAGMPHSPLPHLGWSGGAILQNNEIDYLQKAKESRATPLIASLSVKDELASAPSPSYRKQSLVAGGEDSSADATEPLEKKKRKKKTKKKKKKRDLEEELEPLIKEEELAEIQEEIAEESLSSYVALTKWTTHWNDISQAIQKGLFHPLTFDMAKIPSWQENLKRFRDLEAEGLFVGFQPRILPYNVELLNKRLQITDTEFSKHWTDESNRLAIASDPLSYTHTRPIKESFDEENPEAENPFALVRMKAVSSSYLSNTIESPDPYVLVVDLASITFKDHPLMTEEMRLSIELEGLVQTYQARQKSRIVEFLHSRIQALRTAYEDFVKLSARVEAVSNTAESPIYKALPTRVSMHLKYHVDAERARVAYAEAEAKKFQYLRDLRATRMLRDTESQTDRLLEFKIVKTWDAIKALRLSQGYSTAPLNLKIMLTETVQETADEELALEMATELAEVEEMYRMENARQENMYQNYLKEWTRKRDDHLKRLESNGIVLPEKLEEPKEEDLPDLDIEEGPRLADADSSSPDALSPLNDKKNKKKTRFNKKGGSDTDATKKALKSEAEDTSAVESGPEVARRGSLKKKKLRKASIAHFDEPKPSKPSVKKFNEKKQRTLISKRLNASVRPAGSPILSFIVNKKNPLTDMATCPKVEQSRRSQLECVFVYLRLYFNDREVMRTVARPLDGAHFGLKFTGQEDIASADTLVKGPSKFHSSDPSSSATFSLKILENPQSLRVELFEAGAFGDAFLAEVYVPFPVASDTSVSLDRQLETMQFSGKPFHNSFAGKSQRHIKLKEQRAMGPESWVSGDLAIRVSWGTDESGRVLGPTKIKHRPLKRISDPLAPDGPAGLVTLPKLMEWILDLAIDPNDPRNNEIIELKRLAHSVGDIGSGEYDPVSIRNYWKSRSSFKLGLPQWLYEHTIGFWDKMPKSIRHEVMRLRLNREIVFHGSIPFNDGDIKPDMYERVIDPSKDERVAAESMVKKPGFGVKEGVEDLKSIELGFLKRVRAFQLTRQAKLNRPPSIDDYVREARLELPPQQTNPFEMLFRPNRKLNPFRSSRTQFATSCPESCKLVVQVLRGFNIPTRRSTDSAAALRRRGGKEFQEQPNCNPFVEVTFQFRKARTNAGVGANPLWNESISLEVQAPQDDFRPEALMESDIGTDMIFINVFDEIVVDLLQDTRDRDSTVHQRREKSWLGGFQIPFSTVWETLRIEGEFNIKLPHNLLGYELNAKSNSEGDALVGVTNRGTAINLFMTLDPPLLAPPPLNIKFQTKEDPVSIRYATTWLKALEPLRRAIMATTVDTNGLTTLITRYITHQVAPESLTTIPHLRRFVSMIPYLPNRTAFGTDCVLWSTSQEVFDTGVADGIEHAILLCNLILGKEHKAWVVLGRGIPEGITAYVMVQNNLAPAPIQAADAPKPAVGESERFINSGGFTLYHPVSGEEYELHSSQLPLTEIGCIFDEDNVWANVQPEILPSKLSMNLRDARIWKPFYDARYRKPNLVTIQSRELDLMENTANYLATLESTLEKKIVQKIEAWREGRVTRWNRMCSRVFKNLMGRFENDVISSISIGERLASSPELVSINSVYKMTGFPINMPYTDVAAACAAVYNTAVHSNQSVGAEFALAVHCHGYPGRLVSVWIFVANLVRT